MTVDTSSNSGLEADVVQDSQRRTRPKRNIADALAMPCLADIDFEPPRFELQICAAHLE